MADTSQATAIVNTIQLALQKAVAPDKRGQHPKTNACLDAVFKIRDDIPQALRVGLFAEPNSYRAAIRFSNGSQVDDRIADIHGMAIKLFDVPGTKMLEAEATITEHDFVLADHPVFFIRTASDYVLFMQDFAASAPLGKPPEKFIAYLKQTHPQDIPVLLRFRQQIQESPLKAVYWSQVPYAFGMQPGSICRYRCSASDAPQQAAPGDSHDYLRSRTIQRLAPGSPDVVLDFAVQVKQGADAAVIDNPTEVWPEPFVSVATIVIKAQTFDTPDKNAYGERLSFTPWRALAPHRPLGEVNEIRKVVYLESRKVRDRISQIGRDGFRLSREELTRDIDDDFKAVVDKLQRTFGYLARTKHGRATHTWGVAGRGTAKFIVDPKFPANDYFVAGEIVPIVLRHSSPGAREDDRSRDGVAASVKFFEPGAATVGPGVLDILMNAGRQLFVRTIRDFSTFVHASPDERKALVADGIMMEPELIEAYRIRGSFLNSRYHSWQCFEFFAADGTMRYLRFRLIPGDRGPERGLPAASFRAEGAPSMDPLPDDPRAQDFLRQDWLYQVRFSKVAYVLQGQLHDAPAVKQPNPEVLNPAKAWDETAHPWLDLCEITIDEAITDKATIAGFEMNPNRSPACIKIPLATSPDHYASLGHARAIIYPGARAIRAAGDPPENN